MRITHFLYAGLILFSLCGCGLEEQHAIYDLSTGQSEMAVIKILGEPKGRMNTGSRTSLFYDGGTIELVDGKTVGLDAEFADQFAATEGGHEPWTAKLTKWVQPKPKSTNKPSPKSVVLKDRHGNPVDHSPLIVPGSVNAVLFISWDEPNTECTRRYYRYLFDIDPTVYWHTVKITSFDSATAERYGVCYVPSVRVFDRKGRLVAMPTEMIPAIEKNIELAKRQ